MERLTFENSKYLAIEGAIHLNRYLNVKELCKGKKILDLACGEGYGSFMMSEWGAKEVVGIDISKEAILNAKKNFKNNNIKFINANVEDLNFIEDNSFDLIVSFETIEHLSNPKIFLKEIKRVLMPEGSIVISCPNDYFYYPDENEQNKFHKKKYSFNDFKKLTESELGKKVEYMIGVYIGGYINTYPSIIKKQFNQKQMLNQSTIKAIKILPDSDVVEDGSCYYVGFWNCKTSETASIYPYEYNELLIDFTKKIELSETFSEINKNLEKELYNCKSELKKEKENLEKERIEIIKKNLLIKLLNEEKYIIEDNIRKYQRTEGELKNKEKELEDQLEEIKNKEKESERQLENQKKHLDSILYSRTYKLSSLLSKLIKKIEFWR